MDEKDWLTLQTIYEQQSITKAAELLYTSQPALTYRLQQMEDELDVKIIWRSKKEIKFTTEGEYLVKYAKRMLADLQKTKDYLKNISSNREGLIRLGVSRNFAHYRLPAILLDFLEQYPNVQFNVITGWSSEIYRLLQNEKINIAIISGDYKWDDQRISLNKDSLCIISKNEVNVDELPQLPRISYRTEPQLVKNSYKTDKYISQILENWWNEQFALPPKITMEVDKVETCIEMVRHGLGYGIIPSICLQPHDDFYTIELKAANNKKIHRKTWMLHREEEMQLPIIESFVQFTKDYVQRQEGVARFSQQGKNKNPGS